MKKTSSKLQLKANTIRVLEGRELTQVNGGAPTNECTQVGSACGSGEHSGHCPPQHSEHCPTFNTRHCH